MRELFPGTPITLDNPFPQEFPSDSRPHMDAGVTQLGVLNNEYVLAPSPKAENELVFGVDENIVEFSPVKALLP